MRFLCRVSFNKHGRFFRSFQFAHLLHISFVYLYSVFSCCSCCSLRLNEEKSSLLLLPFIFLVGLFLVSVDIGACGIISCIYWLKCGWVETTKKNIRGAKYFAVSWFSAHAMQIHSIFSSLSGKKKEIINEADATRMHRISTTQRVVLCASFDRVYSVGFVSLPHFFSLVLLLAFFLFIYLIFRHLFLLV